MPQVFIVVRCYSCDVFQVQQLKKVPKWVCKMCGAKQSLKKEYGRGTGAECRKHVQKLNMMKASADNETAPACQEPHYDVSARPSVADDTLGDGRMQDHTQDGQDSPKSGTCSSIWHQFIEEPDITKHDDEPLHPTEHMNEVGVVIVTDRDEVRGRGKRRGGGARKMGTKYEKQSKKTRYDKNTTLANRTKSLHPFSHGTDNNSIDTHTHSTMSKSSSMHRNRNKGKQSAASVKLGSSESGTVINNRWSHCLEENYEKETQDTVHNEMDAKTTYRGQNTTASSKQIFSDSANKISKWGQFIDNDGDIDDTEDETGDTKMNTKAMIHGEQTNTYAKQVYGNKITTSDKWGQYIDNVDIDGADTNTKTMLQGEQNIGQVCGSTIANGSRWGQYIDNDGVDDTEDDSCGDYWDNEADVSASQQASIEGCDEQVHETGGQSDTDETYVDIDQRYKTSVGHDGTSGSWIGSKLQPSLKESISRLQPSPKESISRLQPSRRQSRESRLQPSLKQSAESRLQHSVKQTAESQLQPSPKQSTDPLAMHTNNESSSSTNHAKESVSNKSITGDNNDKQTVFPFANQNCSIPKNNRMNLESDRSLDIKSDRVVNPDTNLFALEDHHLDEVFSDDW